MERSRGNVFRTTIVCVDSYENGVLQGRFYNPAMNGGAGFTSLIHLLRQMEDMLDMMRLPQSFSEPRSFGKFGASAVEPQEITGEQVGKVATFAVRILFRQNASWQGSITWLERKQEESFRSVLELVLLMDSALRTED